MGTPRVLAGQPALRADDKAIHITYRPTRQEKN